MKIILTSQEYANIRNIMEAVEAGSVNQIGEAIKVNPLVSVVRREDFSYEMTVDHEYMAEYLAAASESMTIIVPMVKSIAGIGKVMFQKFQEIVEYHIEKHRSADKKAAVKHGEEAVAHIEDVLIDVVRLADSKVEKFEDLDRSLQRLLVIQYGETVKSMVNKMLAEKYNRPFS